MAQPYLFFEGRTEEAVNFYKEALGAEVEALMRFKDAPDQGGCPTGAAEKIMHGSIKVDGATVMMSDGDCTGKTNFQGFGIAISPPDEAAARKRFDALAAGGKVTMPLGKTFWSPCFGMVTDKFGVFWMISVMGPDCP